MTLTLNLKKKKSLLNSRFFSNDTWSAGAGAAGNLFFLPWWHTWFWSAT